MRQEPQPYQLRLCPGQKQKLRRFTVFPMAGDIFFFVAFACVFIMDANKHGCCGDQKIVSPEHHPTSFFFVAISLGTKMLLFASSIFLHDRIIADGRLESLKTAYVFGDASILRAFNSIFDWILVLVGLIDLGDPTYLFYTCVILFLVTETAFNYMGFYINSITMKILKESIEEGEHFKEELAKHRILDEMWERDVEKSSGSTLVCPDQ